MYIDSEKIKRIKLDREIIIDSFHEPNPRNRESTNETFNIFSEINSFPQVIANQYYSYLDKINEDPYRKVLQQSHNNMRIPITNNLWL